MKQAGGSLAGNRVLVTRAADQASELIDLLESAGAEVLHLPTIAFTAPPTWESLDRVLDSPTDWDWIIFTSSNGVASFFHRAESRGLVPPSLAGVSVAAVGAATAGALLGHGIEPDVVPGRARGIEILPLLPDNLKAARITVVRALEGRDELPDAIREKGGSIHVAVAYETRGVESIPDSIRSELVDGRVDALTFTSPSTAENFLRLFTPDELTRLKRRARFISIGPTTTSALRTLGIESVWQAPEASMSGMLAAVVDALEDS